jgi:DNA helicase HerA-like ATPase
VYHLVGRETTCPDEEHVEAFSLQFSQLSPYLVMEILGLTEAQEQRYLKAYDIAKLILSRLHIFPKTQQDMQMLLEIDEMEIGYPKMRLEHMYDVVQAYAMLAALEGTRAQRGNARTQTSFDFTTINFRSSEFKDAKEQVAAILEQEKDTVPGNVGSWRVIQGHLGRLLRANLFDNGGAKPLNYNDLTMPGHVSIIDLSDVDSPYMNNLVIAELLRGLLEAQNSNYEEATKQGREQRRTMVIIEEAHEFLSSERIRQMPMLFQQVARIARRGRKRWFGLVFVTQLPQHLPDEVLGLINNYILHKISDANVISRLKRSLGVIDDSLWKRLPSLAPGQALVAMSNFARPLLVNIDPTPCKLRMIE